MNSVLRVPLLLVLASMGSCAASWFAADAVYRGGSALPGYWIGLLGSALPAVGTWLGLRYLRRHRERAEPTSAENWFKRLLVLALTFVAVMGLFPLL
ncbi:MAG: hypothetical protein ABI537_17475 [Casimicrobiaceae bacterium]